MEVDYVTGEVSCEGMYDILPQNVGVTGIIFFSSYDLQDRERNVITFGS